MLKRDVPLETSLDALRIGAPDPARVRALFTELGFQSLIPRLAPAGSPKSGTTGWIEDAAALGDLMALAASLERVGVEVVTSERNGEPSAVAIGLDETEACVVRLGGDGGLRAVDLAPLLGAERPEKVGSDLKRASFALGRAGVELCGLGFDASVASYVIHPSRQSHRIEDLALELFGRNIASFDEGADAPLEAAAERVRTALQLRGVLGEQIEEQQAEALFREIEMPLVGVLARMEAHGVGIDRDKLSALGAEFDRRLETCLGEIYALAGTEFNVSSPPQLREVLFDRLKISSRGVRRGKTGLSTDVDVLTRLAREHPLPDKILSHRMLSKLKSTYVDALVALVDPRTGRIHCSFNQTVAATGRLSSSDPNLQNIPIRTDEGRRIREAFVPAPGNRLISADYSQIELRLLAHLTGDATLQDSFRKGEDIHRRTAAEVFRRDLDAVAPEERRAAKVINFGIIYGMGPARLARELDISLEAAEEYIRNYFARYPGVSEYVRSTVERARRTGYVTTLFGRRRFIPDIASREGGVRQFAERTAVNTPIQGSAADLIKVAMIRIDRELRESGAGAAMILQVHDELIFEAPEAEVEAVVSLVRKQMTRVAELAVPLEVEVGVGGNWAEIH
jgi:DNA polymerase-1